MKFIATISLCLIGLSALAQKNDIGKYQIKLYGLYNPNLLSGHVEQPRNGLVDYVYYRNTFNPTIAINRTNKKGNRHEIELSGLAVNETNTRISSTTDSSLLWSISRSTKESKIVVRYEYIHEFLKNKKFRPSVGVSLSPYYIVYNTNSYHNIRNIFTERTYGIQAFIIPRLNYYISKRILIDLNIPLKITEHQYSKRTTYAANKTVYTGYYKTLFEDMFYARLGIGINI